MIRHVSGNLLLADVEALVNTVNTVGVMGKGIALQFRQAYPPNYEAYRRACERGEVVPGRMFVFETKQLTSPRYIVNFPTKRHWRAKSRMEDIESGLVDLIDVVRARGIRSIAVPPLGCSNGGLDWNEVRPLIEKAFESVPDVHVLLYAPHGAPAAEKMPVATHRPNMTPGRAALIGVLRSYALPGYRLTMLEVEKLAYFLQTVGEPLRLQFIKGDYGPYAETLHHVLQRMEGHFIRGYGDRTQSRHIRLIPDAVEEADASLKESPDTVARLSRVSSLIDGFETPYGMELLATVHWVAREDPKACHSEEAAVRGVHAWSERKRQTFRADHIAVAWRRLRDEGWL